VLVRQFKLADQPHDFLDIERAAPSPDFQDVIFTHGILTAFFARMSATGQTLSKISP
jgi:hypothetical protein